MSGSVCLLSYNRRNITGSGSIILLTESIQIWAETEKPRKSNEKKKGEQRLNLYSETNCSCAVGRVWLSRKNPPLWCSLKGFSVDEALPGGLFVRKKWKKNPLMYLVSVTTATLIISCVAESYVTFHRCWIIQQQSLNIVTELSHYFRVLVIGIGDTFQQSVHWLGLSLGLICFAQQCFVP